MARRIDIELTSARPDGSWTWRAAGALQPRGVVDGTLLHAGAKVGDVVRADADFEIEGISITAVLPPKERHRSEPERIELLESRHPLPGVTTQLAGRTDGRRARDGRRPRGDDPLGARPDRPGRPRRERDDATRRTHNRPPRHREAPAGEQESPSDTPSRPPRAHEGRSSREGAGAARPRRQRTEPVRREPEAAKRAGRRLNPANTHRRAVLDSLPAEERPVAEQVLRGGIPAVRTAIHLEREKANAEGRPPPHAEELLALAESLLPRLKAAEWRDRAEAVSKAVDEVALRDLRSVVAGADLARDDETRQLAADLRASLERRLAAGRESWSTEIGQHLDEGRVVRALRLAGRPPEVNARLTAELAARLAEAAGAALSPDVAPDRWTAVLDAVVASPVRRSVKPAGLPVDPTPELLRGARQQVGRVPALAAMLGVSMPPPPGPVRPSAVPPAARRPPRPAPTEPTSKDAPGAPSEDLPPATGADETADASAGGASTEPDPPSAGPSTSGEAEPDDPAASSPDPAS